MSNRPDLRLIQSPQCRDVHFHAGTQAQVMCNRPEGHGGGFHEGPFPVLPENSKYFHLSGSKYLWPTVDSIFNQRVPAVPLVTMTEEELREIIRILHGYEEHKDLMQRLEAVLEGTE